MNGLAFLRKNLQLSGEEFGDLIDVKKSSISKWENDASSMPQEQKKRIADMFLIPSQILSEEIEQYGKEQIVMAAFTYNMKKIAREDLAEKCLSRMDLSDFGDGYYRGQASRDIMRICDVYDKAPDVVNILVAAAEKYLNGYFRFGSYEGQSEYTNGCIRVDDPYVNIISSALEAALGKK